MLKAMANLIRPAPERRVQRLNSSRSPPAAPPLAATGTLKSLLETDNDENSPSARPSATRRTSRNTSHHDDVIPQKTTTTATATATATATTPPRSSRKRPASAIEDATTDARPPTKVTVTQPHGELFRITNGVPKSLGFDADDVPSGVSTPTASGAVPPRLAAPTQTPQQTGTPSTDKRSLRSHDGGSRLKSDLATYFSGYDDIIAGVEKSPEFFGVDAPIYIIDEPSKPSKPTQDPTLPNTSRKSVSPSRLRKARAQTPPRRSSTTSIPQTSQSSTTYQEVDYSAFANITTDDNGDDPLADSVYFAQHRRAERKEKQLRNIEKERAMHEKVQLERLLDGLQGPDWIKVMGISGVTDGEKKDWEPKRDYFVKEVEALVDKFRLWKEQEKRVRAEKEAALAREEEEEESSEPDHEPHPKSKHTKHSTATATTTSSTSTTHSSSSSTAPHATSSTTKATSPPTTTTTTTANKPRRPPRPHGFFLPLIAPEPKGPFTSFYAKPHLRAAALGKHRHGRNASAFGQPIPEWEEREFELPGEFLSPEFLKANARERRRRKRESVGGGAVGGRRGGAAAAIAAANAGAEGAEGAEGEGSGKGAEEER